MQRSIGAQKGAIFEGETDFLLDNIERFHAQYSITGKLGSPLIRASISSLSAFWR
jgi:hypothetical protein